MNKPLLLAWVGSVLVLLATAVGLFFARDAIDDGVLSRGASDVVSLSLGLIAAFLIIIVTLPYAKQRAKRLAKKFKQVAEGMGMKFSEEGDSALFQRLGAFDLFRKVNRGFLGIPALRLKKITNVLHGDSEQLGYSEEFKVTILGCWYQPIGSKSPIAQTVICFRSPELSLPQFDLRPENLVHKMGSALGYQDIVVPALL